MMMAIDDLEVVRSPRAKRMRLTFDTRIGKPRLIIPQRAALGPALRWAGQHEDWISKQRARQPEPSPIVPGMQFTFAGDPVRLDWSSAYPRGPVRDEDVIFVGGPLEALPDRLLRWLRRESHKILQEETRDMAERHAISIGRVGVGDPVSRWGSCAPNGDIRYNWRLILAPAAVRQATVAHEVAHRLHMDHSPAFHAAVARLFGRDPLSERRWLKRNSALLHGFGRGSTSSGRVA